ncbi:hypothetical protein K8T06_13080 [bacterium]|nr:hypothetical protein [bacterium]
MKKLVLLAALLVLTTGVNALDFTIAPGSGYSEPMSQGSVVAVGTVITPSPVHTFMDAWHSLFYGSMPLGLVYTTFGSFDLDGYGYLIGSDPLDLGAYTMADACGLHVETRLATTVYSWDSNNTLVVGPTGPMTPSTSTWGLIILLLGVPAVIIWRR